MKETQKVKLHREIIELAIFGGIGATAFFAFVFYLIIEQEKIGEFNLNKFLVGTVIYGLYSAVIVGRYLISLKARIRREKEGK